MHHAGFYERVHCESARGILAHDAKGERVIRHRDTIEERKLRKLFGHRQLRGFLQHSSSGVIDPDFDDDTRYGLYGIELDKPNLIPSDQEVIQPPSFTSQRGDPENTSRANHHSYAYFNRWDDDDEHKLRHYKWQDNPEIELKRRHLYDLVARLRAAAPPPWLWEGIGGGGPNYDKLKRKPNWLDAVARDIMEDDE